MLEDLMLLLPPHRALILKHEFDLLKSTIDHEVKVAQYRERADLPDFQGLEGHRKLLKPKDGYVRVLRHVLYDDLGL
jgi:hypothetical protein